MQRTWSLCAWTTLREADALDRRSDRDWGMPENPAETDWDPDLEMAHYTWMKYSARLTARWRERPKGWCSRFGCGGRVHRFAWHGACPEHHDKKYSAESRPIQLLPSPEYFARRVQKRREKAGVLTLKE